MKKLIIAGTLLASLCACNAGSDSSSSSNDVQDFSSSLNNNYSVTGTATGCETISSTGTCTVTLDPYSASNSTYQGQVGLTPSTGYTSTVGSCSYANSNNQSCTFTITNNGTTTATLLTITLNGTPTGAQFYLAGSGS